MKKQILWITLLAGAASIGGLGGNNQRGWGYLPRPHLSEMV